MNLINLIKDIADIIFIDECLICKKTLDDNDYDCLCRICFDKIIFIKNRCCNLCGRPILGELNSSSDLKNLNCNCNISKIYFCSAHACGIYEGVLKELIHILKFQKKKRVINILIKLMLEYVDNYFDISNIDFIIPVPLYKKRLNERGFNQSQLLIDGITKKYKIPKLYNNLVRIKQTLPQFNLTPKIRLSNIKGAFKIKNQSLIKNKKILLIDDIYTTGATVNECAKTLIKSGAEKVYVLTIAHSV